MTAHEFNCPKCGGVVTISPDDEISIHCPYCNSLIEIPEQFRNNPQEVVEHLLDQLQVIDNSQAKTSRKAAILVVSILGVVLIGVFTLIAIASSKKSIGQENSLSLVEVTAETVEPPTITPTLNFAYAVLPFGGSGNGEGLFNNPRYIDADGLGNIYVADYDNGRIQRFNTNGDYQNGWSASDSGEIIHGMAVSYTGFVYVSVGSFIKKFDGQSGQFITSIQANGEEEYGDLATTIDGNLVAVWYEGRWGVYDSADPGHRVDMVMFDPDLNIMSTNEAFISSLIDDTPNDILLAVDGTGTIYAYNRPTIFMFDKGMNFTDRFTPSEGAPGAFSWVSDIAVDGQGRVYVLESYTIHVFDSNFGFIDDIPLEKNANAFAIDAQNNIWVLSSDQVQKYQLR